jgi:hypothetical protein
MLVGNWVAAREAVKKLSLPLAVCGSSNPTPTTTFTPSHLLQTPSHSFQPSKHSTNVKSTTAESNGGLVSAIVSDADLQSG